MKSLIIFSLLLSHNSFSSSEVSTLIVDEIKRSIISEYGLKDSFTTLEETIYIEEKNNPLESKMNAHKLNEQKRLGLPTDKVLSGKERVELLKQKNKNSIVSSRSNKVSSPSDWMDRKKKDIANWQDERLKQLKIWEEERAKFLSRVDDYKKGLAEIPKVKKEELKKIPVKKMKQIKIEALPEAYYIEGALDLPIKDQGKRPTCASFAGVRSIEILLNQKKKFHRLSEQYFYFSSKPECKSSPCAKGGSWVFNAFSNSKKSSQFDIPKEEDCSYNSGPTPNNDTQIPLERGCQKGFAKVEEFALVQSNNEIMAQLQFGNPVIVGVKLSENFYTNKGHVFLKDSGGMGSDSHANGHALLLVGFIRLPESLHKSEGRFCFLSANSWGNGWGRGGHSCLSEKWFDRFRFDMPFVALSSVSSKY